MDRPETRRCPVEFDHDSPDHAKNWPDIYKSLRTHCPHAWTDQHGGFWVASKYEDILKIAQRPETFTAFKTVDPETGEAQGGASIPPLPMFRVVPNESESPEWNSARSFLNRRFAPQAIEEHRANTKLLAAALIDLVIESGRFDIVNDFTNALPALATMAMFGFPLKEWREFSSLFHKIVYVAKDDPEHLATIKRLDYFLRQRVDEEIEIRRRTPRDDLFTYLAHGTMDGRPLDRQMIHSISFGLIGGGVGTTAALTAHVLRYLSQSPADRQRLIDDPELLPRAREEFVRYFSPVPAGARNAKDPVNLQGWEIDKGERVLLAFASANRDEAIFDAPEDLQIDRFPNRHIGFGAGMHRCLGSFFARMLFETMVTEVLARIPDYRVIEEETVPYPSVAISNGWIRMPATFTPGRRVGATIPG